MLKNSILVFSAGLILAACSAKVSTDEVAPPIPKQKITVASYTADFSNEDSTYKHRLNLPINSAGAKIKYFIRTTEDAAIEFGSPQMKVTGCSMDQVTQKTYWYPDSQYNLAYAVESGSMWKTRAGTQGVLMYDVSGLTGCTHMELSTVLKKKTVSSTKCMDSLDQTCRAQVSCREKPGSTNNVEVEVGLETGGLTLYSFTNDEDGTRVRRAYPVTISDDGTDTVYRNSSDKSSLKYNNETLEGVYYHEIMGLKVRYDVKCSLLQ